MSFISMLAVYFIIWWVVLFAVLPFGVKSVSEGAHGADDGHDPGAPIHPQMVRKALITTLIAGIIFALFYVGVTTGVLSLENLASIGGPKRE
jgi:predicted secreted protein